MKHGSTVMTLKLNSNQYNRNPLLPHFD